ncbi:MAG: acyl carrier protein [Candidatus Rokuibacteriota bacterium]
MKVPVSRDEIFQTLRQLLIDQFELRPEQVVPTAHLRDDLDLDSIDWINLAVYLEEATGYKLGEEELTAVRTIQDVVDMLHDRFAHPA